MSEELMPCPMCENKNVNWGVTWTQEEFWVVCGDNCVCEEDKCNCDHGCGVLFSPRATTKAEVIKAWNKRT